MIVEAAAKAGAEAEIGGGEMRVGPAVEKRGLDRSRIIMAE